MPEMQPIFEIRFKDRHKFKTSKLILVYFAIILLCRDAARDITDPFQIEN